MVRRILSHHRFLCPPRSDIGLVVGGPGTVPPRWNASIFSKWVLSIKRDQIYCHFPLGFHSGDLAECGTEQGSSSSSRVPQGLESSAVLDEIAGSNRQTGQKVLLLLDGI